jgi:hypothetical protein
LLISAHGFLTYLSAFYSLQPGNYIGKCPNSCKIDLCTESGFEGR